MKGKLWQGIGKQDKPRHGKVRQGKVRQSKVILCNVR
jgi:hypothetical protein